jgi:WhiB family redox-sensing transcriptional regulator
VTLPEEAWRGLAPCRERDVSIFYPEEPDGSYSEARAICALCVVREPCLESALRGHERYGMWGGATPGERRRLERARRLRRAGRAMTA